MSYGAAAQARVSRGSMLRIVKGRQEGRSNDHEGTEGSLDQYLQRLTYND